ncbi:MAG: hypothetical protein GY869_22410, partial [Planctomycetes bacterium]|nr:hypothetical protein [Planctomycetota bacterium]
TSWEEESSGALLFSTALGTGANTNTLTERMVIDQNGNVGIGTVNPESTLSVLGDFDINSGQFHVGTGGNVGIGTMSPRELLDLQGNDFSSNVIIENTDTIDGHVVVELRRGNSTAENSINFETNDTVAWKIGMDNKPAGTEGDFAIKTANNAAALFTVKSDGNVGIGTTNPSEKLEVNGTVQAARFKGVPWRSPQ